MDFDEMISLVPGILKTKDGELVPAKISRMFDTHGPYVLDGQRLDTLKNVSVLVDSSTTTSHQMGMQHSHASTSSVIGRAVVGGVLAGGTGALIGGATGKRDENFNSITTQELETKLTVELEFVDSKPVHVIVVILSSYHWLLEQLNQEPASDEQLLEMEKAALEERRIWGEVNKITEGEELILITSGETTITILGIICLAGIIVFFSDIGILGSFGIIFLTPFVVAIVWGVIDSINNNKKTKFEAKKLEMFNKIKNNSLGDLIGGHESNIDVVDDD